MSSCCWYHKGTNFQANHNTIAGTNIRYYVVADTTKVQIFKQITTNLLVHLNQPRLLLIPQRYKFSSKSQHNIYSGKKLIGCCWYHKGTNFQANHNWLIRNGHSTRVVADTTKVQIFKQITTLYNDTCRDLLLLLIPQRYKFSSKSQHRNYKVYYCESCCWYHKGTNFQANHNPLMLS